jgi:ribonuclease HI
MHQLLPDLSVPVTVVTDAGDTGFAGMLLQNEKPVGFISRTYQQKGLQNGGSMLRELFAIKETLNYFRADILSRPIDLITDNQAVIRALDKPEASNPFLTRIFSHLSVFSDQLRAHWVPRTDPRISLVDALGRV